MPDNDHTNKVVDPSHVLRHFSEFLQLHRKFKPFVLYLHKLFIKQEIELYSNAQGTSYAFLVKNKKRIDGPANTHEPTIEELQQELGDSAPHLAPTNIKRQTIEELEEEFARITAGQKR